MKIFKIITSFLLTLGILILMIWSIVKTKDQNCTGFSIVINSVEEQKLITESDILAILQQNHTEWEGKKMKEIDLSTIHKILAQESFIKSVDKVHFSGTKLQIEITPHNIILEITSNDGEKFLLDDQGIYLPFSPKVENDVIHASGFIPNTFQNKQNITPNTKELFEIFFVASLIKADPVYTSLFSRMEMNEKQEIILHSSFSNLPILFGNTQDAEKKLKAIMYMYSEVLPYMERDKYTNLDVRFQNRIVAKKS